MPEVCAWVAELCAKYRIHHLGGWVMDSQAVCYMIMFASRIEVQFECAHSERNNTFQIQF